LRGAHGWLSCREYESRNKEKNNVKKDNGWLTGGEGANAVQCGRKGCYPHALCQMRTKAERQSFYHGDHNEHNEAARRIRRACRGLEKMPAAPI
jgi:hypothetical protein